VHGFDRITENPQHGDLFIASCDLYDCTYGHIGYVVRGWDGNTFGTIEQNAGIPNAVSRHNRTMANVDGFLRTVRQDIVNPAPTPTPAPTPEPAPAGNVYIVQPGDSLSVIGDTLGINWVDLYEANRDVIGDNPNLIHPGQELRY
jgi:hypothetical protein